MTELRLRLLNAWLCLAHGHYTLARPKHGKYRITSLSINDVDVDCNVFPSA